MSARVRREQQNGTRADGAEARTEVRHIQLENGESRRGVAVYELPFPVVKD